MSKNNYPFQVLVSNASDDVLAASNGLDDLSVGQIGVFDAETNQSIDENSVVKNFYIAVGRDSTGGSTLDSIGTSAGQNIQREHVTGYTLQNYTAGAAHIVDITGYDGKCDSEFLVKVEFVNDEVSRTQGTTQFVKNYSIKTPCCEGCEECPTGDCNDIPTLLTDAINADENNLVTASAFVNSVNVTVTDEPTESGDLTVTVGEKDYTVAILDADDAAGVATKIAAEVNTTTDTPYWAVADGADLAFYPLAQVSGGITSIEVSVSGVAGVAVGAESYTDVLVADEATFLSSYPTICLGLKLTANELAIRSFCNINLKYFNPRQTVLNVSLLGEGFDCNGTVTTAQEATFEEGAGYDIKQKEYHAGGWNGSPGPYRVSSVNGTAKDDFVYYAENSTNYHQVVVEYNNRSQTEGREYENPIGTIVAFPSANTTARESLLDILDAQLTPRGFTALSP